MKVGLA